MSGEAHARTRDHVAARWQRQVVWSFSGDDQEPRGLDPPPGRLWHFNTGQRSMRRRNVLSDGKRYVTIAAESDVITFAC